MGLGKTVQCVSLVGLLAQHMGVRGPFLVVVPLSTVPNWIREFRKWVPMVSGWHHPLGGTLDVIIRPAACMVLC
jgi:SNF2 family DNA or RNA helicase